MPVAQREVFVHLAYLDDSGTKDGRSNLQVMAGVIIEGWEFRPVEFAMAWGIEQLIPEDRFDKFEEFHAWELFGGYGIFDGIEQEKRFAVVAVMLHTAVKHAIPIIYGSVNKKELAKTDYGSAEPLDICFRMCVRGINAWAGTTIKLPVNAPSEMNQEAHPMVVLIADDFQDNKLKKTLRESFRTQRNKLRPPDYHYGEAWHLHDDLYFGSSKDSVGIQLADLCAYIVRRNLEGDAAVSGFYETIKKQLVPVEPVVESKNDTNAKAKAAQ